MSRKTQRNAHKRNPIEVVRVQLDLTNLTMKSDGDVPDELRTAFMGTLGSFSEQQRAALQALWMGRRCANIENRNDTSLWEYNADELRLVDAWRQTHPDVEYVMFRGSTGVDKKVWNAEFEEMALHAGQTGLDVMAVMKQATFPATGGTCTLDFSDLRDAGWPASWSFGRRWTFDFNRTLVHGHPVLEIGIQQTERA